VVTLAHLVCAAALAVVALQPLGFRLPTALMAAVAAIVIVSALRRRRVTR